MGDIILWAMPIPFLSPPQTTNMVHDTIQSKYILLVCTKDELYSNYYLFHQCGQPRALARVNKLIKLSSTLMMVYFMFTSLVLAHLVETLAAPLLYGIVMLYVLMVLIITKLDI